MRETALELSSTIANVDDSIAINILMNTMLDTNNQIATNEYDISLSTTFISSNGRIPLIE
jgi:hypothetical protein